MTIVEYGFLKDEAMFLMYNMNDKPESGIFLINMNTYNFSSDMVIKAD
jgi:hypothetical protein